MHNFIIDVTEVGIISGRIHVWGFFSVVIIVASQTSPGENRGNPPLILAPKGVDYSLSLLFSTKYYIYS